MHRSFSFLHGALAVCAVVTTGGCELQRLFPDDVGTGVAQLTVRNFAELTQALKNNKECGLASPAVLAAAADEGELGGAATRTLTVSNCRLSFAQPTVIDTDCNGKKYTASGEAVVSATYIIHGTLSGNADPDNAIIPAASDAVSIDMKVAFTNFSVEDSTDENKLTVKSGEATYTVRPHLAKGDASLSGVCAIPTRDVGLEKIAYAPGAKVFVETADKGDFAVDVGGSNFDAQVGSYAGVTNSITGTIKVWDHEAKLPVKGAGLDPKFDAKKQLDSYACVDHIAVPASYECANLAPTQADGAARLSVSNVGAILQKLSEDTSCGFKSSGVIANTAVTGEVGVDGGQSVQRVENCVLDFGTAGTEIHRNCNGIATKATGKVSVSASLTLHGINTGDATKKTAIVPTSARPAEMAFQITFDHFEATLDGAPGSMEVIDGTITGSMQPRMAIDAKTGACAIATPNVTFNHLAWDRANVLLSSFSEGAGTNKFHLTFGVSDITAQNGKDLAPKGPENTLTGTLVVDGKSYDIPSDKTGAQGLDPNYDPATFAASYACTADLKEIANDAECSFKQVLGENAGRLLVMGAGAVTTVANKSCWGTLGLGELGSDGGYYDPNSWQGWLTWSVDNCSLNFTPPSAGKFYVIPFSTNPWKDQDCMGGRTYANGTAKTSFTRRVEGLRSKKFLGLFGNDIKPNVRGGVTLGLHNVNLTEFDIWNQPANGEAKGYLTMHEGVLNADVQPMLAQAADDRSRMDISTPIAKFNKLVVQNGRATLKAKGLTFHFHVDNSELSALNGSIDGQSNYLKGTITIDGVKVNVDTLLNPDFSQAQFDLTYQCLDNLGGLVSPLEELTGLPVLQ